MLTTDGANDILNSLAEQFDIPGASCVITQQGERVDATMGWARPRDEWAVTPDTTFQIGSITKMLTAMLVMMCVEEGKVSPDSRVVDVLPELGHPVDDLFNEVTVAQLLQHTNGTEAQYWTDLGRGDHARRWTARAIGDMPLIHQPGEIFSYSGGGYVLAGYLVEQLLGRTWEAAVQERICRPLGITSLTVLPEEAVLTPTALGHLKMSGADGQLEIIPALRWQTARGHSSGGAAAVSARDLVTVADAYAGTMSDANRRLLSSETVELMQRSTVDVPGWRFEAWGLGHAVYSTADDRTVIGHDGQSPGQSAGLRIVPCEHLTVAVCCNAQWGSQFTTAVADVVILETCGIRPAARPVPPGNAEGHAGNPGRYRRLNSTYDVRQAGGTLDIAETQSASDQFGFFGMRDGGPHIRRDRLQPITGRYFIGSDGTEAHFLNPDATGRARWLHDGFRLALRAEPTI